MLSLWGWASNQNVQFVKQPASTNYLSDCHREGKANCDPLAPNNCHAEPPASLATITPRNDKTPKFHIIKIDFNETV